MVLNSVQASKSLEFLVFNTYMHAPTFKDYYFLDMKWVEYMHLIFFQMAQLHVPLVEKIIKLEKS
jgi:hypothetical protein